MIPLYQKLKRFFARRNFSCLGKVWHVVRLTVCSRWEVRVVSVCDLLLVMPLLCVDLAFFLCSKSFQFLCPKSQVIVTTQLVKL